MLRFLFTIGFVLACPAAMSQTSQSERDPADAMRELRIRMLTTPPGEFDIRPSGAFPRVYGVLMDWPVRDVTVTIVSLSDGSASLYSTSTFGVIGGIAHESVRRAATAFVKAADAHYTAAAPAKEYPYPKPGRVNFYLVGFEGVRLIEAEEKALVNGEGDLAGLWNMGQEVMTELRLVVQKKTP